MFKLISLVSFVALVYALPPPDSLHPNHHHGTSVCDAIHRADCTILAPHHVICGTDAKTYNNHCEFSKARCSNMDLHAAHNGTCDPTVQHPDPNVHGDDLVYKFFCTNLQHSQCGSDIEIVCGTDMTTYNNLCQYEKARCSNSGLKVLTYQACPSTQ